MNSLDCIYSYVAHKTMFLTFFGKQTNKNPYKQTKNPKTNPKYFNTERMLIQHVIIASFKHICRPLYVENKTWRHLQNCRLRLKKANKAAKASKNRKRFRKSIIIHSACSSCFIFRYLWFLQTTKQWQIHILDVEASLIPWRQAHKAVQIGNNEIDKLPSP